jgi:hypothetical protein
MNRRTHLVPLLTACGVVLVCGLTALIPRPSTSVVRSTLSGPSDAESSAMECPVQGPPLGGSLTVLNSAFAPRTTTVTALTGQGTLGPVAEETRDATTFHAYQPVVPQLGPKTLAAMMVEQSGSGFVGSVRYRDQANALPCHTQGVTSWYTAGMDTVGTDLARLVVTNPTATPAVINVATWSSLGYDAPAEVQGLVINPTSVVIVDLTPLVVQASELAVKVTTLRGVVDVQGLGGTKGSPIVFPGSTQPTSSAWFPAVSTSGADTAVAHLANETNAPIDVTISTSGLGQPVSDFTLTVPAQTTTPVTLVPSSRMPSAGDAVMHVVSTQPVSVTMTGTRGGAPFALIPSQGAPEVLAQNVNGATWRVVNPTRTKLVVTLRAVAPAHRTRTITVAAHGVATVSSDQLPTNATVLVTSAGALVTVVTAKSISDGLSGR